MNGSSGARRRSHGLSEAASNAVRIRLIGIRLPTWKVNRGGLSRRRDVQPTQELCKTRLKFRQLDRLSEEQLISRLESPFSIVNASKRREGDGRNLGSRARDRTDFAHQRKTILAGHADVADQHSAPSVVSS